jgi:hypothetical protein
MRIEGVVAPVGGSTRGHDGYTRWSLTFTLDPWREVGGEWRRADPLWVLVPAPSQAVARRQAAALRPGGILRLAIGAIVPRSRFRSKHAVGRPPVRRIAGDATARAVVAQRERPHTVRDGLFGTLRLERALDWLSTKRRIDGAACELSIAVRDADDAAAMGADVAKARPLLLRTEKQLPSVRGAIARELLGTYNGTWRHGRPKLSRAAFLKRITLTSINLAPERVTLYFGADGMFTEHAIEVRLGPRGAISEVTIA